jgi:hypothetical protein
MIQICVSCPIVRLVGAPGFSAICKQASQGRYQPGRAIAAPGVITAAHGADGGYLEAITESPALSSYGWTIAEPEEQRRFVDGVGLRALFNAAPQDHRDAFIAWLVADLQRTERPSSLQTERIGGRASGHELDIPPNLRRGPEVRR